MTAPTVWYVVPAEGDDEYEFATPFAAHRKLNQLGVEGDVEMFSARTGSRDVVAHRNPDGSWGGADLQPDGPW